MCDIQHSGVLGESVCVREYWKVGAVVHVLSANDHLVAFRVLHDDLHQSMFESEISASELGVELFHRISVFIPKVDEV